MATYGKIQGDINTMNEAQRNDAARAAGYTGWSDYMDNANRPAQNNPSITNAQASGVGGSAGGGAGITQGMFTGTQQAGIDLPSLYKNLTATSGIQMLQDKISEQERAYNKAIMQINDNPFLSEATRVGRLQKLRTDYDNSTANLRNDIATKKADIDTQLGLQTKQFDINNTITQQNIQQFNSLLSSGALNNASSDDIAAITRATGISSSMIQGAVQALKEKSLQTTVQTYDDGTNQGYKIITLDQYGNIVNSKTEIAGPSAKTANQGSNIIIGGGSSQSGGGTRWKIVTPSSKSISDGWSEISMSNPSSVSSVKQFIGTNWTDPSSGNKYTYTNMGFA